MHASRLQARRHARARSHPCVSRSSSAAHARFLQRAVATSAATQRPTNQLLPPDSAARLAAAARQLGLCAFQCALAHSAEQYLRGKAADVKLRLRPASSGVCLRLRGATTGTCERTQHTWPRGSPSRAWWAGSALTAWPGWCSRGSGSRAAAPPGPGRRNCPARAPFAPCLRSARKTTRRGAIRAVSRSPWLMGDPSSSRNAGVQLKRTPAPAALAIHRRMQRRAGQGSSSCDAPGRWWVASHRRH
jgi:hypothetical protein